MQFRKMPHEIMERSDLTPSAKNVFCYLLDLQGSKALSWPGMTRIGRLLEIDRRTVNRAVKLLVSVGLIAKKNRRHGQSNLYSILWPNTGQNVPSTHGYAKNACDKNTGQNVPGVGQNVPRTRDKMSHYSDSDLIIKQQTLGRCAPGPPKKSKAPKRSIRDSWKELCSGYPDGSDLSESSELKKAWLAHWKTRKKKIQEDSVLEWSKTFLDWGLAASIAALEYSKKQGYIAIVQDRTSRDSASRIRPGDYRSGKIKSYDRTCNAPDDKAKPTTDRSEAK